MVKPYAVVLFIGYDGGAYSEIPSNWLLNNNESEGKRTMCQWSTSFTKYLQQMFKHRVEPKGDWSIQEINILRYCDTLAEARKAPEDSEYEDGNDRTIKSASEMPTIPTIEDQRKIPLVSKISSSVRKVNETNNCQSTTQEHFEDKSRATGMDNGNDDPSDSENYDDDNGYNVLNEVILKKFATWNCAEFSKAGINWIQLGKFIESRSTTETS